MGKIVTNAIRKTYKSLIKSVVKDLGETILVYGAPEKEACPNCYQDLVTGESKNIVDPSFVAPVVIFGETISPIPFTRGRCPVCKGVGFLLNEVPTIVKALVKWNPKDGDLSLTPAGIEGANIARIKARRSYYQVIRDAEYFIVDGVKCVLSSPPVFRGLGAQDELVVAFLQSVSPGPSVKES